MKMKLFIVALFSVFYLGFINAQSAGTFSQVTIGTRTGSAGTATRVTINPVRHNNTWTINARCTTNDAFLDMYYSNLHQITFNWNTGIGIGTTNPQHKLDVNGKIRAKEIIVETGWADFVFAPEYNLPSLREVEMHIKEKGHLPEIPSEKEVLENGVSLGEMNVKLLQKIEELTLYVIEQNKRIEVLEALIQANY